MIALRQGLFRFREETRGSVLILFTLALIPILLIIAAAVSYSMASNAKAKLQNTLDSAVLAAVNNAQVISGGEAAAAEFISKWMAAAAPETVSASLSVTLSGGTLTAYATEPVSLPFNRVLGASSFAVGAKSVAQAAGSSAIELVLALDTTYSMDKIVAGDTITKFEAAKAAAASLTDTLFAKAPTKTKIGLVPFDWHIRLPVIYKDAWWITDTADLTSTYPPYCVKSMISYDVTYTPYTYDCGIDGVYKQCTAQIATYSNVVYGPDICYPASTSTLAWRGCVGSRLTSWNTTAVSSSDPEHGLPGYSNYCQNEIVRLSTTAAPIKAAIAALTMGYETYIPASLLWSWRLLAPPSATEAFGDGATPGPEVKKYVVLLSDGANSVGPSNTEYLHNDFSGSGITVANDRMTTLCAALKASGVQIFTVAFDLDNPTALDLLKNCASGPNYFYNSSNTVQLTDAFNAIAASLAGSIRLVK